MLSDLNMSHGEISDFVSFPLFEFTLFIKLRNFGWKGHYNISIFSDIKIMLDLTVCFLPCHVRVSL